MIRLTPFHPADLIGFDVQPAQREADRTVEEFAVDIIRRGGEAITIRNGADKVIFVGGVVFQDHQFGQAWCVMAADAGADMVMMTRACRYYFDSHPCQIIAFMVDMRHPPSPRWGRLLGFEDRGAVQWLRDPDWHLFVKDKS